jgi:S-DNA-T family DNA segregation ATPase FtsK/SpoIIIE
MPLIAVIAPIAASIALWMITKSAMALVFAALGPIVAIATTIDARLHRRKARRTESKRFAHDCEVIGAEIDRALDAMRARVESEYPSTAIRAENLVQDPSRWGAQLDARLAVRLGTATTTSRLELDLPAADSRDPVTRDAYARLRDRASLLPGTPLIVDPGAGVGFVGPEALTRAAARALLVQLAVRLSPERVALEGATEWMAGLPHAREVAAPHPTFRSLEATGSAPTRVLTVTTAATPAGLPRQLGVIVVFDATGRAQIARGGGPERPTDPVIDFLGLEAATVAAARLASAGHAEGIMRDDDLPHQVEFRELPRTPGPVAHESGLRCVLGIGHSGAVEIDLARDGPHAVVGGTTGSGKSELLLSWVLGMADGRGPDEVTFLFVDFKGGAAFEPLARLPHCVGVITDLEPAESLRALGSLTAELRYRERTLLEAGLRSIDNAPAESMPFPRLVVVVDEYATLVERQQDLHGVFGDIAARGRSLGVHLILCTQRPAGVVRDSILANCALRVSLRVHSQADSVAVVGTNAAALLPARPLGRAVISRGGEPPELLQVGHSDSSDVAAICDASAVSSPPRMPWLPPLATSISPPSTRPGRADLGESVPGGLPIGMVDRPELQLQEVISWDPSNQGSLLITGAGRSGKSGVLAAIEAANGGYHRAPIAPGVAALWDALTDALDGSPVTDVVAGRTRTPGRILLIDDLDLTIAACQQDYQSELVDLLGRVLREGPASGVWCAVTAQRASGGLHALAALCGSAMVLRMSSRAEHVGAGGDSSHYEAALPPGGARWLGHRVQVFDAAGGAGERAETLPAEVSANSTMATRPRHAGARCDFVPREVDVAVVSTAPARFARAVSAARPGSTVTVLDERRATDDPVVQRAVTPGEDVVVVGDPQLWQAHWSLLAATLRSRTVLFDGCSLAELRAVTGRRELPPPFDRGERTLWSLAPGGDFQRARLGP